MKLEKPPSINIEMNLLTSYYRGEFNDFMQASDLHYYYWDELKHKKNLPNADPVTAWSLVKIHRRSNAKRLDVGQTAFQFFITESIQESLHEFDLKLIGGLYKDPITPHHQAEYLKNSILEEAIASSQMEGAATTTEVAFEMLKSGRNPRNESEQMIFNNLRGIQLLKDNLDRPLDFALIIEIHRTMTARTSAEKYAGDFRDRQIFVTDHVDGEIAHIPPEPEQVEKFMQDFCDFANSEKPFIHPIVKASILHFLFGYIHPFMDGNGRTARALFYWFLLKKEYAMVQNISISRAILNSRTQYDKAFLKTEMDENDMTYFVNYSIKTLKTAFDKLINYRDKKKQDVESANLIAYKLLNKGLSKRQADVVGFLYSKPAAKINIAGYAKKHAVVRQTARKDLSDLLRMGLIAEEKQGRDIIITLSSKEQVDRFLGE